jgi:wyosine [tRNA(Phe)-imidazoG37] synthetase (radical SAM superfamily)
MSGKYKYLFGPVPSRRLGRSLGIDVTPDKSCSFDCLFCQCGQTENHAAERAEFVPFEDVCAEIDRWLAEGGDADYITFAGSGEPTLYSQLGELIDFIKEKTETPVIVLSNGTLLHRPDVREETTKADIVKISLSAWDEASFQKINRPSPGLSFETLVEGERCFRKQFGGQLWLEVFILEGINAERGPVQKIASIANSILPDKIHLNTAVRPAADAAALPVSAETLASFCSLFEPTAEVIASFGSAKPATETDVDLAALIHRHPATSAQLAAMTGRSASAIEVALAPLLLSGQLQREERNGETYYK